MIKVSIYSVTGNAFCNKTVPQWKELINRFPKLPKGGHYLPRTCVPQHHVAIIVPYRDRVEHLKLFLQHMHSYLQTKEVEYTIFIVEQVSICLSACLSVCLSDRPSVFRLSKIYLSIHLSIYAVCIYLYLDVSVCFLSFYVKCLLLFHFFSIYFQDNRMKFKKGLLMNAGFLEVSKRTSIKCFMFHDVDMLPLDYRIDYSCTKDTMWHPSIYIRQYNFRFVLLCFVIYSNSELVTAK